MATLLTTSSNTKRFVLLNKVSECTNNDFLHKNYVPADSRRLEICGKAA